MSKLAISQTTEIAAPPERVFDVISDFNTWRKWSPWLCADSNATVDVSSDSNSEGSIYKWNGEIVGEGEMQYKRLVPSTRIEANLRCFKPFKSKADVAFDLQPSGDGTKITWSMDGNWPWFLFWMKKMITNVIDMDYERGLKMLKEYIETGEVLSQSQPNGIVNVGPIQMVGIRKTCGADEIGPAMEKAICDIKEKVDLADPRYTDLMSAYHKFDMDARTFDFTVGLMTSVDEEVPGLVRWSLPASKAVNVKHTGTYENLGNAWNAAYKQVEHKKLKQNFNVATFEVYRNDPNETAPRDLVTDIYLPLK